LDLLGHYGVSDLLDCLHLGLVVSQHEGTVSWRRE
jgi:hypothetical protein